MGMPALAKRLHKETNRDLIDDEVEAIENYDKAIEESDNPEDVATYEHIKGEEEEHIEELEGLDKMKADDITSEQAWEDFKAGYSDFEEKHIGKGRDGDQASLEEKIDILSAKISELNTDMSRLTDSVPQALGTIEEGKTLEEEAEDGDGDLFGGEDDGLGDFFGEDDAEDEAVEGEEGIVAEDGSEDVPDEETPEDGEEFAEDEEVDYTGESDEEGEVSEDDAVTEDDDEIVEDEEESTEDDDAGTSEDEANDDEDYISMDEIMSDEDEEEESEEEEVLEKMVRILDRMDKRITHLEKENVGLKKMLSQQNIVQTEPRSMAKSRPRPNTNLRLVKGSYNRPPVSTQYVANQRDIGIGKRTESSSTSVFRQGLNEVFADCNRIANQTR